MQTNDNGQQFGYSPSSTKTVTAYKLNRSLLAMAFYLPLCAFDPRWSLWPDVIDIIANRWNEIETGFTQDIDLLAKEIRANTDALLHSPSALRSYYKFLDNLLLKPVKQFCEIDFWKDTVYKGPYKCEQARINSCPLYPFQELISEIQNLLLMEDRTDLFNSWGNVEFGDIVEDEAALRPALIKFNRLCTGLMREVNGVAYIINSHFELAFPDIAEQESELVFTPVSAKSEIKRSNNVNSLPNQETEYDALVQLFASEKDFLHYIDVLRKYEKPTIDDSVNWVGKKGSRSILMAWVDRLESKGKMKSTGDRGNLIPLLMSYFKGLEISRRTAYHQPKADTAKKLKDYFVAKIPH
ncbi:hypothetical protein J2I47_15020 [Fibrella sp. HMF5335]|uniref:Uncharacterized protein n=1 Tax=Fibrella rubiginis TaxID=2817060 RepID=A0A939K5K7_9BACT|nr:hypothetical protein [Fibrella rubiginis]MBO0937868.1 hypothetical protein [Fibrella rubiginis]